MPGLHMLSLFLYKQTIYVENKIKTKRHIFINPLIVNFYC